LLIFDFIDHVVPVTIGVSYELLSILRNTYVFLFLLLFALFLQSLPYFLPALFLFGGFSLFFL
jgi:hypothetical protein